MERSTYYRRKKEAVVVFAFSLWGAPFEKFRQSVMGRESEGEQMRNFRKNLNYHGIVI